MPRTGRTPSLVPYGADQTVYLVVDRFGRLGSVYRETEVERTDLETIIAGLMAGQFNDPVNIRVDSRCTQGVRFTPKNGHAWAAVEAAQCHR
jgi:hypothetical protein